MSVELTDFIAYETRGFKESYLLTIIFIELIDFIKPESSRNSIG